MSLILLAKYYAELGVRRDVDRRRKELDRLGPLFKFLDEHCQEPLLVNDAAKLVGMSTSHFMGFFKRATGQSFVTYVNHFRVAKAQELLTTSDMPIADIGRAVGFCNHSYFGMVFRQAVGTTPLAFRRNCGRMPNPQPSGSSVLHMGDALEVKREDKMSA